MTRYTQTQLVFHASIIFLVALLCGVPYSTAITSSWGEDAVRAWRLAHLGLALGAIWLFAVAAISHLLKLSPGQASLFFWSLLSSAYGFAVALPLAAVAGVRGLELTGPFSNLVAFAGNVVGAVGSLVATAVMLLSTYSAIRKGSSA